METLPRPVIDSGKPLRADARRNRERILKAARAVFADQGIDAQMDDVAKRAKVGVGTVYRHFPTKEALVDALVRERFEVIAGQAREALEHEDAWEGFCELIWRSAEGNAADRAFSEIVAHSDKTDVVEETGLLDSVRELIARAQAQGRMRADATEYDVGIVMCGAGSVMQAMTTVPDAWRRYLTLMLDGLRAS
jgi:AcrR family transcriptional regulator